MMRIFGNILALISFFLLPFYATIAICIILGFIFDYIEIIFFGFLFDVVYSIGDTFLEANAFTIGSVLLYLIIYIIKQHLKL